MFKRNIVNKCLGNFGFKPVLKNNVIREKIYYSKFQSASRVLVAWRDILRNRPFKKPQIRNPSEMFKSHFHHK